MTVDLELNGNRFVGINGGPQFKFDEAISLQITCDDQDEVDHFWDTLVEGGGSTASAARSRTASASPGRSSPTASRSSSADPDPKRAERAMKAMLGMGKLDIAALSAAADGVPAA